MKKNGKKVFVGLSGGVDSSVSAALLKEKGYDVEGVFIRVWQPDFLPCSATADRLDAMRVAAHLGIPFRTLDLEREYKEGVIDRMLAEYAKGRTPNPDALCNRDIKFGAFLDYALSEGADMVATGHYARVAFDKKAGEYALKAGCDKGKDQSYFLWMLTQRELGNILFPVGGLEKTEVRRLARRFKLPTAEKKDSQGLCFVGDVDMKEFLAHYFPAKRGAVLDENGQEIGEHDGALFYTIGERGGFAVRHAAPYTAPLYVVAKDMARNTITVATRGKSAPAGPSAITLEEVNRLSSTMQRGETYGIRARYRAPLEKAVLRKLDGGRAELSLKRADPTLAPGQSAVLYAGETCVGGGIISSAIY